VLGTDWECCIPPRVVQTSESTMFGKAHFDALLAMRGLNPGVHFEIWDRRRRDQYMDNMWGDHPVGDLYRRSCFGAMKADLFRYCVVFDKGGFYLDVNKLIIAPLRSLVDSDSNGLISFEQNYNELPSPGPNACLRLQHPDRWVVQWAFGFKSGHPFLARVIQAICEKRDLFEDRIFSQPSHAIHSFTGPSVFTSVAHCYFEQQSDSRLMQAGIDFHSSYRRPSNYEVMYLNSPHYKKSRNAAILRHREIA